MKKPPIINFNKFNVFPIAKIILIPNRETVILSGKNNFHGLRKDSQREGVEILWGETTKYFDKKKLRYIIYANLL